MNQNASKLPRQDWLEIIRRPTVHESVSVSSFLHVVRAVVELDDGNNGGSVTVVNDRVDVLLT